MNDMKLWPTVFAAAALSMTACGGEPISPDASVPPVDASGPDAAPSCPTGTSMCGTACVDTESSRTNCGACGTTCEADEACVDGTCGIVCPSGQAECDGICADTETDRRHCGACGTACAAGEACVAGTCEVSCPGTQVVCDGACADTQSDPANCGACGTACDAGEVCSAGACAASCGAGLEQCGGACVSTLNDPAHCGGCDAACPTAAGASGLCMAGSCIAVCDALLGDCNADRASPGGDGCETALATDVTNCGACGRTCTLANAAAGCAAGACVVATCDPGWDDCDSSAATGCETDVTADTANCGGCGVTCAAGQVCGGGTCLTAMGDTCATAIALAPGANSVAWTAFGAEYITSAVSCGSGYAPEGPDLVLTYTAATAERVTIEFEKPTSTRWHSIVSVAPCGTLTPELACISDWSPATMSGTFELAAGETAYVYVVDTTSGTLPLDNPLTLNVTAVGCAAPPPVVVSPPNGGTTSTLSPEFTATFAAPVVTTAGTITITGDLGTALSYDLATSPSQVSFSGSDTVMTISPGMAFPPGETLTLAWTGISATPCTTPVSVPSPTWVVDIVTPSCAPGVGGIVGTTTARVATGLTTTPTEYYVAADDSSTGYVYVGGTTVLYRIPKTGGSFEEVHTLSGAGSSQLGYAMLVDGANIYTVDDTTSTTLPRLFRISSDGGASWAIQNYATFSPGPSDDFRALTAFGGRIYLLTEEDTDSVATEIWSVGGAETTLPAAATLELSIAGEGDCMGLARDSMFYYLACDQDDRIVRVPVAGGTPVLLTDTIALSSTNNELHGADTDSDGVFDVLYVHADREEAYFICSPAGTPYVSLLYSDSATSTSNYGMGIDRAANVLWTFDDDAPRDLVRVQ
jgi:hypothetical protein